MVSIVFHAITPSASRHIISNVNLTFRISNSALESSWMRGGIMLASMTAWICSLFPAVMFEMVQHASFRMPFFAELRRFSSHGNALKLMIT